MAFKPNYISYRQTGSFSRIVTDYLDDATTLRPFYSFPANIEGLKQMIKARKQFKTNRNILVQELLNQYAGIQISKKIRSNIKALLNEETFTICTAHQPNIFTGHLYFIFKILHTIKLAEELKRSIPDHNYIPVYYMGSEDADLDELGEITINGKKYKWETKQKGAVGRMKIDHSFIKMIEEIAGQISIEKYGLEILKQVKEAYTFNKTIEQATFEFVHALFADYGLLILLPDNPALKNEFTTINRKELKEQFSNKLVSETITSLPAEYKVQAAGRNINLFYLKDDIRERIYKEEGLFKVQNTELIFSETEMLDMLDKHPERFSPNVILRPVFQELILPNIAFIGGGGELAYWLELKKVFAAVSVPFPVMILRNSFMLVNKKNAEKIGSLKLNEVSFFKPVNILMDELVKDESDVSLNLEEEKNGLSSVYHNIRITAKSIDPTLFRHVEALETQALNRIEKLEKKMLNAEKKKFEAEQRQIHKIKEALFPGGTLQERVDNLLPYYAVWGKYFISMLYENSKGLEQEFCILTEL